jgi:hypothetical protein
LSHFPIVPSATLSPSWGIVTLATNASSYEARHEICPAVCRIADSCLDASLAHSRQTREE